MSGRAAAEKDPKAPACAARPAVENGQFRLLPASQPLVERLGAAFFRGIPRQPGVYRMYDEEGRLVYVGKAGDLRARLGSYRRASGQSRKTVRLIHAVRRIEWDCCETETAARLMENEWIRVHRPRFNRAGTWPKSARYIQVCDDADGFGLSVVSEVVGECYGAFRGGPGMAVASLARLLWMAWEGKAGVEVLPRRWITVTSLRRFHSGRADAADWLPDVRRYLGGLDDGLLVRLVKSVGEPEGRFDRAYVALQFEVLQEFYRKGPRRNREMLDATGSGDGTLPAEKLDDLQVAAGRKPSAPAFRPEVDGHET